MDNAGPDFYCSGGGPGYLTCDFPNNSAPEIVDYVNPQVYSIVFHVTFRAVYPFFRDPNFGFTPYAVYFANFTSITPPAIAPRSSQVNNMNGKPELAITSYVIQAFTGDSDLTPSLEDTTGFCENCFNLTAFSCSTFVTPNFVSFLEGGNATRNSLSAGFSNSRFVTLVKVDNLTPAPAYDVFVSSPPPIGKTSQTPYGLSYECVYDESGNSISGTVLLFSFFVASTHL